MAEKTYTYPGQSGVHVGTLLGEIAAALPEAKRVKYARDGTLSIVVDPEYSAGDETLLNSVVSSHSGMALDLEKTQRKEEIDGKTKLLIEAGFPHDSQIFSMSDKAQDNWWELIEAATKNWISFPYEISTKGNGSYSMANAADVDAFVKAGWDHKEAQLQSGRALKLSIDAATTRAAVDAVVDSR